MKAKIHRIAQAGLVERFVRLITMILLINIQRLRNLTTSRLHTEISHVYEDLENIIGERGLLTHMLPNVKRSVEPWLRKHVPETRFWDGEIGGIDYSLNLLFLLMPNQPNTVNNTVLY
jgi:hypothetical protein